MLKEKSISKFSLDLCLILWNLLIINMLNSKGLEKKSYLNIYNDASDSCYWCSNRKIQSFKNVKYVDKSGILSKRLILRQVRNLVRNVQYGDMSGILSETFNTWTSQESCQSSMWREPESKNR